MYSDGKGFSCPHKYNQLPSSCNGSVKKISLQHNIVLGQHRDDDGGKLRALRFVHGDRIRKNNFVQIDEIKDNLSSVKSNAYFPLFRIDLRDPSHISIEDVLFIVIPGLHHLVAYAEDPIAASDASFTRIQPPLQLKIEVAGADNTFVHRGNNLDFIDRVEPEMIGDSVTGQIQNDSEDRFRDILFDEKEIAFQVLVFGLRKKTFIDPVCIHDDAAVPGLTKDCVQQNNRNRSGRYDIFEYVSRPYGGKLIYIAHEDKCCMQRNCFEKMIEQDRINHGGFVNNQKIAVEWF